MVSVHEGSHYFPEASRTLIGRRQVTGHPKDEKYHYTGSQKLQDLKSYQLIDQNRFFLKNDSVTCVYIITYVPVIFLEA